VDIPNLAAATTFDIGTDQISSRYFPGDILWFACGTGALSDADAAAIHAFGAADPTPDVFPGSCTAVMPMDSAAYLLPGNPVFVPAGTDGLTFTPH
jgi:hypothetical protein